MKIELFSSFIGVTSWWIAVLELASRCDRLAPKTVARRRDARSRLVSASTTLSATTPPNSSRRSTLHSAGVAGTTAVVGGRRTLAMLQNFSRDTEASVVMSSSPRITAGLFPSQITHHCSTSGFNHLQIVQTSSAVVKLPVKTSHHKWNVLKISRYQINILTRSSDVKAPIYSNSNRQVILKTN